MHSFAAGSMKSAKGSLKSETEFRRLGSDVEIVRQGTEEDDSEIPQTFGNDYCLNQSRYDTEAA